MQRLCAPFIEPCQSNPGEGVTERASRAYGEGVARPPVSPRALAAARGDEPADLLIVGGRVLCPLTREWARADLAIADSCVVGWGARDAREVLDVAGAAVTAGFVDAHMHLESTKLWVDELVRAVLPLGTTAVACDPHEIANVLGVEGVRAVVAAAATMPFTFGVAASSCVPASPLETSGARFTAREVAELLDQPGAIGVAEVMNYPGVVAGDPGVRDIVLAAGWRSVDGHAPGLTGRTLDAYLAGGIESDHESSVAGEALEKRRKGMWVFLRQGSASQDLVALLPVVRRHGSLATAFCTDDREPDLLLREGHVNHCVRLAVAGGVSEIDALLMATWFPARFHHLHRLGDLGPGHQADLCVFDRLEGVRPSLVLQAGSVVAEAGRLRPGVVPDAPAPPLLRDTMHLGSLPGPDDLVAPVPPSGRVRAIGVAPRTLRTTSEVVDLADPAVDLAHIAVVERHHRTGRVGLAYVTGFGLRQGALASTVSHDAHNVIGLAARDDGGPADLAVAVARLAELGGGQVVVGDGTVLAELPLPLAGLMSDQPVATVAAGMEALERAAAGLGVALPAPFMALSFLGLSVIPELRCTDLGLIDVNAFAPVPVAAP